MEETKLETLTSKELNCIFWQHNDLGQLTMNEIFFFFEIFLQHVDKVFI